MVTRNTKTTPALLISFFPWLKEIDSHIGVPTRRDGRVAALSAVSEGGVLKLTWSDCGDASTHGKVTKVAPDTVTLGQATRIDPYFRLFF